MSVILCVILILFYFPFSANSSDVYDLDVIKSMGGDDNLFKTLTTDEGLNKLKADVFINGEFVGDLLINYTADFNVIVNGELLNKLNETLQYEDLENKNKIIFNLNPLTQTLEVTIPPEILKKHNIERNLNGFVINYNLNSGYTSDFTYNGQFNSKLLINGYALKNRFHFSKKKFTRTATYLETLLKDKKKILIGESSIQSSMFDGESFIGAQIIPKIGTTFLAHQNTNAIYYAQTPSVVEIHQGDNILYTKDVPTGEFTVPSLDVNLDEKTYIRIIGSDGRITQYPYDISNNLGVFSGTWYSLASGVTKDSDNFFATATYGSSFKNTNYSFGSVASNSILNVGGALNYSLGILNFGANVKVSTLHNYKYDSVLNARIKLKYVSLNIENYKGNGYNNLSFTTREHERINVSLLGNVTKKTHYNIGMSRDMHSLLNRYYFRLSNVNRLFSSSLFTEVTNSDKRVSISFSIPFSTNNSISSTISRADDITNATVNYNNRVSKEFNYSLGYGHDSNDNYNARMQGSYSSKIVNISSSINKYNRNTSYNMSLSGSSVITKKGLHFSPHKAGDTFSLAVISGDDIAVLNLKGNSLTSENKVALINLKPHESNQITMATKDGFGYVDKKITNTINAKYGQIYSTSFEFKDDTHSIYQVMIDNKRPPFGSLITALDGEFIGVVGEDGFFLLEEKRSMIRIIMGHTDCDIFIPPPEKENENASIHQIYTECIE